MTAVAVTAVLVALWCQDPKANFDFDMAAALLWVLMGGLEVLVVLDFARRAAGSVVKVPP
jgi:hypothetical protein